MRSVARFFMREAVFSASLGAALFSMAFVPPDAGYLEYVDWDVLMLLFSLMAVVAGLKESGLFDWISRALMARAGGMRRLAAVLTVACFFASMLVTNDVALMTFVPLTVGMLAAVAPWEAILVVSLETVAANLGSMATPIGNPQNLFLYAHYGMSMGEFLRAVAPISAVSLLLLLLSCLLVKRRGLTATVEGAGKELPKGALVMYALLFLLCVLAVLRAVPKWTCALGVVLALLIFARRIFREIDYALLGTFVCFFLFVGNLARVDAVSAAARPAANSSSVGGPQMTWK
jgi:Na+/H+ antiporter NhaD/arsenite permease-like protein